MPLQASFGYNAAPVLLGPEEKAWLAAGRLPTFSCPARVEGKYHVVGPFLEKTFIPLKHCSNCFLQREIVLYLRKMVWLFRPVAARMNELGLKANRHKPWKDAAQQLYSAQPMELMTKRRADILPDDYNTFGGFSVRKFLPEQIWKTSSMTEIFWNGNEGPVEFCILDVP